MEIAKQIHELGQSYFTQLQSSETLQCLTDGANQFYVMKKISPTAACKWKKYKLYTVCNIIVHIVMMKGWRV